MVWGLMSGQYGMGTGTYLEPGLGEDCTVIPRHQGSRGEEDQEHRTHHHAWRGGGGGGRGGGGGGR